MDRDLLEQRIRSTLHDRAGDVEATPELWERVSQRTARRARWQLGLTVLSGAAAVAALVFGLVAVLGPPRSVQIDPVDPPPPGAAPITGTTVVTSDGGDTLFVVDADTGAVLRDLKPYEGFAEAGGAAEVAVRPVSEDGEFTVATVLSAEGSWELEVSVFDADGTRIDRQRIGSLGDQGALPSAPAVVWSENGRYLLWAGEAGQQPGAVSSDTTALFRHDWAERPMGDDVAPVVERAADLDLAAAAVVDLRGWHGDPAGQSIVALTTTDGVAFRVDLRPCGPTERCTGAYVSALAETFFEGGVVVDEATLGNGVELALVARSTGGQDAEGATLLVAAAPMSDDQQWLELPDLTPDGTADPFSGWIAAAGDRIVVGFGGQTAYLVTVQGDTATDLRVVDVVALPAGTVDADARLLGDVTAEPGEEITVTPTEAGPGASAEQDGAPSHVVSFYPSARTLLLEDRAAPDEPVATWDGPDDLELEFRGVVVHPQSTPDDTILLTRWGLGEADEFWWTRVRDGQVTATRLPDGFQPDNVGGAAETPDPAPVFSPTGDVMAWLERPAGAQAPSVRLVEVGPDGPRGGVGSIPAPDGLDPAVLLDWAHGPGGEAILTFSPMAPFDGPIPATMIELRLRDLDGAGLAASDDDWSSVALPGVLVAAGAYLFEDGSERYVVLDGPDGLSYGLAEAPETAVALPIDGPDAGRVVAFGPASLVVQRADGSWARVQVDDGATSTLTAPGGAVAFLPWPGPTG